jgi:menaquinone-dependent protoporphyrinogen oxidase
MRILVVYASADGSTAGIGRRIAQRLRERGHDASDQPVGSTGSLHGVDAVVLGSAVHGRQWLDEATSFVNTNRQALHNRPFWTFSVGMPDALPKPVRKIARTEENAIINQLGDLRPRGHRLFSGVVKPSQFPLASRIFLRLAGGRYGDFRDWPAIDGWALEIADQLDGAATMADAAKMRLDEEGDNRDSAGSAS